MFITWNENASAINNKKYKVYHIWYRKVFAEIDMKYTKVCSEQNQTLIWSFFKKKGSQPLAILQKTPSL